MFTKYKGLDLKMSLSLSQLSHPSRLHFMLYGFQTKMRLIVFNGFNDLPNWFLSQDSNL